MSFAVWLTGLSSSGKSAIAQALVGKLHERGVEAARLESDALRAMLTPFARYDDRGRDRFYATLLDFAAVLAAKGIPVVIDATANKRAYRDAARARIARFLEVYVDTPLQVCEARDPKGLYRRARSGGAATLPGLQAAYEPPAAPELVVHGDRGTPEGSAEEVLGALRSRGWIPG